MTHDDTLRVLNQPFDLKTHLKTFTSYLEVIIHADGKIEYAVPSHIEKLRHIAMDVLGVNQEDLDDIYWSEFYDNARNDAPFMDFGDWLMKKTGCISIWYSFYEGNANNVQKRKLLELKNSGAYNGHIIRKE